MKACHRVFAAVLAGSYFACSTASQDLGNDDPKGSAAQEAGPGSVAATEGGGGSNDGRAANTSSTTTDGGDSVAGRTVVLFGGFLSADMWSWNGTAWTKLNLNSLAVSPGERKSAVMAPLGGKLVLFGGSDPGRGTFGDTWTWDGTTWTNLHADVTGSSPAPREGAVMAPLDGKLVLFGGENTGLRYDDTWTWDGKAWAFVQVAGPPARSGAVMAPFGGKLLLFGGGDASDTWTWDGAAWTQVSDAGPPPRSGAVMAPVNGKLLLFGGTHRANAYADTWEWDGTQWTELHVTGPSARSEAAMTSFDGKLILFGGMPSANGSTALGETWAWDGSWTPLNAPYHPPANFGSVMAVRQ